MREKVKKRQKVSHEKRAHQKQKKEKEKQEPETKNQEPKPGIPLEVKSHIYHLYNNK